MNDYNTLKLEYPEAQIYLENRTQALCVAGDDFVEALKAFQEKRPPRFNEEK